MFEFVALDIASVAGTVAALKNAEPVMVSTTGWSPTTYGVWALVALMTPIVLALTRMWPAMRKMRNESDGSLRGDLLRRISDLETSAAEERAHCTRQLLATQNKMDAVVRQFVQFQLTVVRHMPSEFAPEIQRASTNLMAVIARDVSEFAPAELDVDEEALAEALRG